MKERVRELNFGYESDAYYDPQKQELSFSGKCHLSKRDFLTVFNFLDKHPEIISVCFSNQRNFSELKTSDLEQWVQNSSISRLDLSGITLSASIITTLMKNKKLRSLNLSNCSLSDDAMLPLALHEGIIHLNLRNNEITDIGVRTLAQSKSITQLEFFSRKEKITEYGAIALAKITELSLDAAHVSEKGLIALAESTTLIKLSLTYPRISNKIAELFAKNNTITELTLWDARDSSGSWSMRQAAFNTIATNTYLRKLDLDATKLCDDNLRPFLKNKTLTELNIGVNAFSTVSQEMRTQIESHLKLVIEMAVLHQLWGKRVEIPKEMWLEIALYGTVAKSCYPDVDTRKKVVSDFFNRPKGQRLLLWSTENKNLEEPNQVDKVASPPISG